MTLAMTSGGILTDVILWVRRIIKSPSNVAIPDSLIGDYINRFYQYDMPERVQLFELKRQYTFESQANIFEYQAPFSTNPDDSFTIPAYQMFLQPAYCDGVQMGFYTNNRSFYSIFPEFVNNEQPILGDGSTGPYTITFGGNPITRGFLDDLGNLEPYVFITYVDNSGNQQYIVDSSFTDGNGNGILIQTDSSFQNILGPSVVDGGSGTVNYITGVATFTFLNAVPAQTQISCQTSPFSSGRPRILLFFNNIFKLYPVPDRAYKIQMDAYITPMQFLNSGASVQFSYMSEYIARGAARKILSDNGDMDQVQFYEPFFREQENLVLRRTDRQITINRVPTIFSQVNQQGYFPYTQY